MAKRYSSVTEHESRDTEEDFEMFSLRKTDKNWQNDAQQRYTLCLKKTVQNCFLLLELRQISTNFDDFWHNDGK